MPQLPVDTRYLQSPISPSHFMPHEILNIVESKRSHYSLLFFAYITFFLKFLLTRFEYSNEKLTKKDKTLLR